MTGSKPPATTGATPDSEPPATTNSTPSAATPAVTAQATRSTGLPESHTLPAPRGRHPALYCLVLLLIPATALAASVAVMMSAWFLPRTSNSYIPTIGYGTTLRNAACDVLINGDSTALVGVLPAIITRRTGLSACNIAEFAGMEQVNGSMVLDAYLKNNPAPKVLLFVYVPENLSPHSEWTSVSHFEAILFRLRHQPDAALARALLVHPKELFSFLTLGLRLTVQAIFKKPLPDETLHARVRTLGWLQVPGNILHQCLPGHAIKPPDPQYIQELRTTYATHGTRVLVDVAPMPDCDVDYDFYAARLPGLIDNQLQKFPVDLFNDSGRMHLIEAGTERFSEQVARQIAATQAITQVPTQASSTTPGQRKPPKSLPSPSPETAP